MNRQAIGAQRRMICRASQTLCRPGKNEQRSFLHDRGTSIGDCLLPHVIPKL
jgi:hypothetical protein